MALQTFSNLPPSPGIKNNDFNSSIKNKNKSSFEKPNNIINKMDEKKEKKKWNPYFGIFLTYILSFFLSSLGCLIIFFFVSANKCIFYTTKTARLVVWQVSTYI